MKKQHIQFVLWIGAMVLGGVLGAINVEWINSIVFFIATAFTRMFQFITIPTIAMSIITTLATIGETMSAGRTFWRTSVYTLLTTFLAAIVAAILYVVIAPENLQLSMVARASSNLPQNINDTSYYEYIISIIPNNFIQPFESGNVLSVLLISVALGIVLSKMPASERKDALKNFFNGFQELLFKLIGWLVAILPLGIMAFSAQLSAQICAGFAFESLGKYTAVILGGNVVQFFIVLPIFLLLRGINPISHLRNMTPAIIMAFFTKSSAATLPVTMKCAEERCGCDKAISRFVLPLCTTVNMNGCAAFILCTSLFVMQQGGVEITLGTIIIWIIISVISAIGNAGVPMGCFFLTLTLMASNNMPIGVLGMILPIYTVIDMIETAENVWSDSCVCAMTNKDMK